MSNILYITASIRSDADSISRGLGQRLEPALPWLAERLALDEGAGFDLEHHIE